MSTTNQPCGRSVGPGGQQGQDRGDQDDRAQQQPGAGLPGQQVHRDATSDPGRARGTLARRASRRSTSSRVPPPRHGDHRAAERAEAGEHLVALQPAHPPGEVGELRIDAVGHPGPGVGREGVDHDHRQPPLDEAGGRGDDGRAEHRREHEDHASAAHPELDPVRDPLRELAGADPGQQVEERAQVPGAGAVAEQATVPADDAQTHPVAGADVVLGDSGRGPDALVEAAGLAVEALGVAVVAERVDHEQDPAVLLGRRGGDVQLAAADRDPPADPAQPVAGAERPDVGELHAGPEPRGAVDADQADRPGGLGPGVEPPRVRQHPQTVAVQADRPPAVAGPGGGQADLFLAQHPPAPPARPDLDRGRVVDEAGGQAVRRVQRDVRRGRHHARDVLDVLAVADRQPRGGALALVQPAVVELGVEHRGRVGTVQQPEAGEQDERRAQHHHGRRGADDRGDHGDGPDDDRAGQRRGGPPARGHPVLTASRACSASGPGPARRRRWSGRWSASSRARDGR